VVDQIGGVNEQEVAASKLSLVGVLERPVILVRSSVGEMNDDPALAAFQIGDVLYPRLKLVASFSVGEGSCG